MFKLISVCIIKLSLMIKTYNLQWENNNYKGKSKVYRKGRGYNERGAKHYLCLLCTVDNHVIPALLLVFNLTIPLFINDVQWTENSYHWCSYHLTFNLYIKNRLCNTLAYIIFCLHFYNKLNCRQTNKQKNTFELN